MDHVVRSLHAELHEVRRARDRAAESRTTWGRMKNAAGIVMSLTCAWRVVTGVWHLVFRRELRVDPITQMLSVLIVAKSRVEYVDPKVLSQCLSLLFIAFIVGASLRILLHAVFRLFSAAGGGGGSASVMLVLFTAEVQALYFLSSVLLIRNTLPDRYRGFITEAMGGDDSGNFTFFQNHFDLIFLASTLLSVVLLWAHHSTTTSGWTGGMGRPSRRGETRRGRRNSSCCGGGRWRETRTPERDGTRGARVARGARQRWKNTSFAWRPVCENSQVKMPIHGPPPSP